MFTIGRKKNKQELYLTYRLRESRFSKDFYKALFIALSFHFLLIFLFHVKEPTAPNTGVFLPFTQAIAEVERGVAVSLLSKQKSLSPWNEKSTPQMPQMTASKLILDFSHFSKNLDIDFSSEDRLSLKELLEGDALYD